ncbi:MAG: ABC transporter six-transmembrane domain-containing protein [Actinomycetota bacterium]
MSAPSPAAPPTGAQPPTGSVTIGGLIRRFRARIAVTLGLVVIEAGALLLFPLFVGLAINDLLREETGGLLLLGGLGVASLAVGALRRLIDTRTYATIYETTATELAATEHERGTDVSTIAARSTLMTEFIEFLENSMPTVVHGVIAIVGTLAILAGIHLGVFAASLALAALVAAVYLATARHNLRLTGAYNDELERQVEALATRSTTTAGRHFGALMRWNRKLSDLETLNYSLIYLGVIALLVYSPIAVVDGADPEYGFVFSTIMYVFEYIEAVLAMPLVIQQLIRLSEISGRLSRGTTTGTAVPPSVSSEHGGGA